MHLVFGKPRLNVFSSLLIRSKLSLTLFHSLSLSLCRTGPTSNFDDPSGTTPINYDTESREVQKGASSALTATATSLLLTLVTLYSSCS